MTLDSAIIYYEEIAKECRRKADIGRNDYMDMRDSALEAEQLASWLNELKLLRGRIDAQPTTEERKRGKWIVYKAPDKQHCGLVKCPFCGEDMIAEADEYNFCPNCGADMRGDSDEA